MLKKIGKRLKDQRGLTLVELLAVVVILGIIAAIAVPSIGNIIDKSRFDAAKADALQIISAASIAKANGENVDKTSTKKYLDITTKNIADDWTITEDTDGKIKLTKALTVEKFNDKNFNFIGSRDDISSKTYEEAITKSE
ncbi:type IV pilin protein [Bacillus sp. S/N-304-OC-R1]|uniref:type IV pilin protein n=1 Tax=Bacillus sp. S/N-304-OC-R1 TaxID=2758034 RepID=UPI001C8D5B33|nr:prepilin-type N-terminal cleavage/methylation domain-containing protein [Bacillus sp. S/N-304-OC-R1]MBY0123963.1 prepilin-type N-terminal cleavage/methylation domain-containing protein [Bacillus sp. S/N-304-OC-R1]